MNYKTLELKPIIDLPCNFDEEVFADIVEQIEIKFCPFCGREL